MTATFFPARIPSTLDTAAIVGNELRIHPDDYLELLCTCGFVWPGNTSRELWNGTRLVEDFEAPP
jgi:hypothetical protein